MTCTSVSAPTTLTHTFTHQQSEPQHSLSKSLKQLIYGVNLFFFFSIFIVLLHMFQESDLIIIND